MFRSSYKFSYPGCPTASISGEATAGFELMQSPGKTGDPFFQGFLFFRQRESFPGFSCSMAAASGNQAQGTMISTDTPHSSAIFRVQFDL